MGYGCAIIFSFTEVRRRICVKKFEYWEWIPVLYLFMKTEYRQQKIDFYFLLPQKSDNEVDAFI